MCGGLAVDWSPSVKRRRFLAGAAPLAVLPWVAPDAAVAAPTRSVAPGESIQSAIDAGPGRVLLRAGTHRLSSPIKLRPRRWLDGEFAATVLQPRVAMPAVI